MLLIYFSISRFLIVELYWGFQTSTFKVKYGSPSQADVRHGCVFWLWDNLDKYRVNHDLSWEKDVWTKSIVKTPYICIIQPRSIADRNDLKSALVYIVLLGQG